MTEIPGATPAAGSPFQSAATGRAPLKKIIVAIHGIGSQTRSSTVRSVAIRFGARAKPAVALMPLGYFHIEQTGQVRVSRLDVPPGDALAGVGFAEVFWADIPRRVVKDEDTLEETKEWGATVVSRAHAAYQRNVEKGKLTPEDFQLVEGAVDEVLETVAVLENLCKLAAAGGLFKFDLAQLLRDYLGDVQIVAEFRYFRDQIVSRFHLAMDQIVKRYKEEYGSTPELYVVAHSEGTVVAFLALLQALSGAMPPADGSQTPPPPGSPEWIRYVHGFMTIGSPIDKHLVLWPRMWEGMNLRCDAKRGGGVSFDAERGKPRLELGQRIRWRNYYDYGDPIGFRLDTAERWLKAQECEAFEFSTRDHDFGFSRYLMPGKAHNDYWDDAGVFGHFIEDVVMPGPTPKPPGNRPGYGFVSAAIPYLLSLACHAAGIFLLFKAVTAYTSFEPSAWDAAKEITVLTLLLAGVTVAARLPRLIKPGAWTFLFGLIAFGIGAAAYALFMPEDARERLGSAFRWIGVDGNWGYTAGVIALSGLAVLTGWFAPRKPRYGRRILVTAGALAVLLIVLGRLIGVNGEDEPVWPVLMAGAAYLYLWWLGILLFDLAFMWHRYIRHSVAVDNLWYWSQHMDVPAQRKTRDAMKAAKHSAQTNARTATR